MGLSFDLSTASVIMRTITAGQAEFERDLIRERVKSGLHAARARGVVLGRKEGRQSYRYNDVDMTVFCFAEREHAEKFRARFGGEFIDPKSRPKWPAGAVWVRAWLPRVKRSRV